jgi:hypothetical protein
VPLIVINEDKQRRQYYDFSAGLDRMIGWTNPLSPWLSLAVPELYDSTWVCIKDTWIYRNKREISIQNLDIYKGTGTYSLGPLFRSFCFWLVDPSTIL